MERSQRADPSADHTSQEKGHGKGYDGRYECDKKDTGCDRCGQGKKRVPMKKSLDIGNIVFSGEMGF